MVDRFDKGACHITDEGACEGKRGLAETQDYGHQKTAAIRHFGSESGGGGDHQSVDTECKR